MLEEGEKATRFFFGLERKRASQNLVSSIYVEVFSREGIERAHVAFYTKLFSEDLLMSAINRCVLIILAQLFHQGFL